MPATRQPANARTKGHGLGAVHVRVLMVGLVGVLVAMLVAMVMPGRMPTPLAIAMARCGPGRRGRIGVGHGLGIKADAPDRLHRSRLRRWCCGHGEQAPAKLEAQVSDAGDGIERTPDLGFFGRAVHGGDAVARHTGIADRAVVRAVVGAVGVAVVGAGDLVHAAIENPVPGVESSPICTTRARR